MNSEQLKTMARTFGADLVGVAPVARFAGVPPEHDPLAVFPQAKSLIVVGRKIPRGATVAAESFRFFGYKQLEDNFLAKTTYDLCIWIEAQGHEAVPMFGYDAEEAARLPLAVPVAPGKPAPNVYVDWQFAAQAAGLGAVGRHGLFLTPEYGVRQRFAMLLSDFEFAPDDVADPGFCRNCRRCAESCPLGALDADRRDNGKCRRCPAGAIQTGDGRFHTVDRIPAACGRACIDELESRRVLRNQFTRCRA